MVRIAMPWGGRGEVDGGVVTCLGFDERLHVFFFFLFFYCEHRGPLAAICFHRGPRKTIRWVLGLSSTVLSWSVTQRAGWSGQTSQEEGGPWDTTCCSSKRPSRSEAVLLLSAPSWQPWNTCIEFWIFTIYNIMTNRFSSSKSIQWGSGEILCGNSSSTVSPLALIISRFGRRASSRAGFITLWIIF